MVPIKKQSIWKSIGGLLNPFDTADIRTLPEDLFSSSFIVNDLEAISSDWIEILKDMNEAAEETEKVVRGRSSKK